ncbi:MAG: glycosyltransferase family 2 protein [Methylocella sp.]
MPDVSIIMAALNGENTIGKSIESAQNQTVRDVEIIVVDDGSTDGTRDLVSAMAAKDGRIKCVNLPQNIGAGGARNAALVHATGEWVTILDADDWYEPNRLEVLLKVARDTKADLVADNLKIYDHVRQKIIVETNYGRKNQVTPLTAKAFVDGDNPLRRHTTGYIKPLIRRKFLTDRSIVYSPTYRVGEDFLFVAESLLQGARAFIVPGAYYIYVHFISPTTRKTSPYSHSKIEDVFGLILRGNNELLQKYGSTMDSEIRRALLHRRWILERAVMYKDVREALRRRQLFKAASLVIAQPVILVLIGNIVIGVLAANAQAYLHLPNARR